ncbi:hypothetical protein MMC14_001110 [Varicellaria rhodocarpa]|nr:hypothetical protein [Varicellaria rhodocarpa]
MPTRQAICKLLYILCKVRGPKIISRFLNNEAKYLQPLLDAFESWSPTPVSRNSPHNAREWSWQERYIVLLWLSHLMLTPFDLVTIASPIDMNGEDISEGMRLPAGLPSVAVHIIRICAENMIAPGKERESAVTLLTRLTLRPDMQRIGLLGAMMQWACSYLSSRDSSPRSIYKSVGILSFLAGIISSADAIIIQPFLLSTFQCVENINVKATQLSSEIMVSALARKIIIKILRVVTVAALQFDSTHARSPIPSVLDIILEDTINQLLVALADGDTPVRCAASKALSVITLKLQPMMAAEVLHAVLESLNENVLWEEHVVIQPLNLNNTHVSSSFKSKERNLTTVNSLQWQGLVLTLAHLLFRRSPPPEELPMILNALILALSFEQRSANGTSIGTTVRDAACFGIWSLARRYTTKELLSVETSAFFTIEEHESISILQILANELVVTATLDVSGNIRRGASAALQELVGRHPDTILHGIALVQIVDYHAIAFRHRAITEIAFEAAKIHVLYWSAIMNGLLGWRGIGGSESETRKLASVVLGKLAIAQESRGIEATTIQIRGQLARHGSKDIEKRHGALLTLAAILEEVILLGDEGHVDSTDLNLFQLWALFDSTTLLNDKDFTSSTLRPELTIEAACSLIRALSLTVTRSPHRAPKPPSTSLIRCVHIISISLEHSDEKIIHSVSAAVKTLFTILDNDMKDCLFTTWITKVQADQSTGIRGSRNVNNYISVLGALFEWYAGHPSYQEDIIDALVTQAKSHLDIETRIAALRSLRVGVLCCCGKQDYLV